MPHGSQSLLMKLPAPRIAPSPTVMSGISVQFAPMYTSLPTVSVP
jgi:hypothetical protein